MTKILTRHPNEYLEQWHNHCGAYAVKGVLSAYDKDDKKHPSDYQPNFLAKYTGVSLGLIWVPKVLQSYGVPAQRGSAKNLSDRERIELLKKFINEDKVVMLRIGNGYLKSGKYRSFGASFRPHWITLWGYNDEEKVFYVYDACIPSLRHDKTIPIGNTKRTYTEMTRDWGKAFPPAWRYSYIKVG